MEHYAGIDFHWNSRASFFMRETTPRPVSISPGAIASASAVHEIRLHLHIFTTKTCLTTRLRCHQPPPLWRAVSCLSARRSVPSCLVLRI